jgi:hypothetical protein
MNTKITLPDTVAALAKGLAGMVPGIGPVFQELVDLTIPQAKYSRIEDMLIRFEEKLGSVAEETLRRAAEDPLLLPLFEEAMRQAAISFSETRRGHIASMLKNGLNQQAVETEYKLRLMKVLEQTNDTEIILLHGATLNSTAHAPFFERHREILMTKPQQYSIQEYDKRSRSYIDHCKTNLTSLGLMHNGAYVTEFGKDILRFIDIRPGLVP